MGNAHSQAGESFVLHLTGYFTEQQRGRTLNIKLEYGYDGVLPLDKMVTRTTPLRFFVTHGPPVSRTSDLTLIATSRS